MTRSKTLVLFNSMTPEQLNAWKIAEHYKAVAEHDNREAEREAKKEAKKAARIALAQMTGRRAGWTKMTKEEKQRRKAARERAVAWHIKHGEY